MGFLVPGVDTKEENGATRVIRKLKYLKVNFFNWVDL